MNKKVTKMTFADNQHNDHKEVVEIGNANYEMLFQREITPGCSEKEGDALCVNVFEFREQGDSRFYILSIGSVYGIYNFSFHFLPDGYSPVSISIDNIMSSKEDLPFLKEQFKDYYEHSYFVPQEENVSFDTFEDLLNDMFDYAYQYLMVNGFHISEINSSETGKISNG